MNWPHYRAAAELARVKNARVLVVGANTGEDCRPFIEMGAAEVHGIDPIDDVGTEFQHPKATYHRSTIEAADLPSGYFDLVFSVATLEHIHDLDSAYAAMARLCAPGGGIYCCAAPLWYSPYGHHMSCFDGHPWVHVNNDRDGLVRYARQHGIEGERGIGIEAIADYVMLSDAFNRRPASDYLNAAKAISCDFTVFRNGHDLCSEPSDRQELRATSHYFKAIKHGSAISIFRYLVNRVAAHATSAIKYRTTASFATQEAKCIRRVSRHR